MIVSNAAFSISALAAEIQNDPVGMGYAGNDASVIANIMNTPMGHIAANQFIDLSDIYQLLLLTGEIVRISTGTDENSQLAWLMLDKSRSRMAHVDITNPSVLSVMQSVLSSSTINTLQAMATVPGTRAQQLGWPVVTYADVVATGLFA